MPSAILPTSLKLNQSLTKTSKRNRATCGILMGSRRLFLPVVVGIVFLFVVPVLYMMDLSSSKSANFMAFDLPAQHPETPHQFGIRPEILNHLKSLGDFPKLIHVIWPDKNVINMDFEIIKHGIKRLKEQNPGWKVLIHNDADIHDMIKNFQAPVSGGKQGKEWFPESMRTQLLKGHIIEQTDAFRLMVMYAKGGLYTDIDRVANIPLSDVIDIKQTKLVVPTYFDINFAQDLFGSAPHNDLMVNILRRQCEKRATFHRKNGWLKSGDVMSICYTHSRSLEEDLFGFNYKSKKAGEMRGRKSNEEWWNETRHILKEHSQGLITTEREVWCNGLLVHDYDGCKAVSRVQLYRHFNLSGWTKEVDAVWAEKS